MRDFRQNYYSTLGVKAIDIKPSIETALQGEVLQKERLNKLCLWVRIPHMYRSLVWKILLGVLPLEKKLWEETANTRRDQFELLLDTLKVLDTKKFNDLTPDVLVRMVLLELNILSPIAFSQLKTLPFHFLKIAESFLEICDVEDLDAFWLMRYFVTCQKIPYKPPSPLEELNSLKSLLDLHCKEVSNHINDHQISLQGCSFWFQTKFAGVLDVQSLEGIWDVVIGGAPDILTYTALSLLISSKKHVLACKTSEEFASVCKNIQKYIDIRAASQQSISMWEKPVLERMPRENRIILGL